MSTQTTSQPTGAELTKALKARISGAYARQSREADEERWILDNLPMVARMARKIASYLTREADMEDMLDILPTAGKSAALDALWASKMRPGTSRTCLFHYVSLGEVVNRDTFVTYFEKLAAAHNLDFDDVMSRAKRICRAFCDSYNHSEGILLSNRFRGVHPLVEFEQWYGPNPGYYLTKEEVAEYLVSELKRREAARSSRAKRQPSPVKLHSSARLKEKRLAATVC